MKLRPLNLYLLILHRFMNLHLQSCCLKSSLPSNGLKFDAGSVDRVFDVRCGLGVQIVGRNRRGDAVIKVCCIMKLSQSEAVVLLWAY